MDEAGRGGGEEEKTVALCVGPEISLPLGVRGEEGSGLISSGLVYVLYHTGRVCA